MIKLSHIQGATSSRKILPIKELHYWDNHNCLQNYSLLAYTNKFDTSALVNSFSIYANMTRQVDNVQDQRDMIFIDGTPRLIFHGDDWAMDSGNNGLDEPKVLLPHKLHHVLPKAKIIVVMRNPTDRLLSDYKFYFRYGNQSADDFHDKVVAAISWWNSCKQVAPLKTCLYGSAPGSLPELDLRNCFMRNQPEDVQNKCKYWHKEWNFCRNAASRLRVGLYDLHIKEWMKIFPNDSFLFIRSDDLARDPVTVYNGKILPFLNHPPLTRKETSRITKVSVALVSKSGVKMLPITREMLNEFYFNTKIQLVQITGDISFLWEDSN
jgi:N-acetylgalactosamine 4-sulfate 6-O-sulfotransferase